MYTYYEDKLSPWKQIKFYELIVVLDRKRLINIFLFLIIFNVVKIN